MNMEEEFMGLLIRWVLGFKNGKNCPRIYKELFKELYPVELHLLRNKICPFCGRKFKKKSGLAKHILGNYRDGCKIKFDAMLHNLFQIYRIYLKYIQYDYVNGHPVYRIRHPNGYNIICYTVRNAVAIFVNEILKTIGF